jgi:uncharacterized membrane protein
LGALAHAGGLVAAGIAAAAWTSLPDRVPTHFGADGSPDGWGERWTVWLLPAVAVLMNIGLAVLERYPQIYNYPVRITEANAARQYGLAVDLITLLRLEMAWMFAGLTWGTVQVAKGEVEGLGISFLVFWLAAIFATIAAYIVLAVKGR